MKTNKQKEAGFYLETWHPCQRLILVFSTLPSTYSYSALKKVPKLLGNIWPFSPKFSWFYFKQVPEIFEILLKSTFSHWKKFHFTQNGYYLADSFKNFILYEVRMFIFYCLYLPWNKLIIYTTPMETAGKALEQFTSSSKMTGPINAICHPLTGLENCMESQYIKKKKKNHCNVL